MNFASWHFLCLFLPFVVIVFSLLTHHRARQGFLIGVSVIFYAASGLQNLGVLLGSAIINCGTGILLIRTASDRRTLRQVLLGAVVMLNLSCLIAFKLLANYQADGEGFRTAAEILMPLALSFVTLQQIGFVVACYKQQIQRIPLLDYLFFIFFFPQLVMGPIVRFQDIQDQLQAGKLKEFLSENVAVGLSIFAYGLAKKILLADQLFIPVDRIFSAVQWSSIATVDAWFAIAAFQLQLYLDFSAYADMAIGLARIFGIDLPLNFDRPLRAHNRFVLWQRWHITYVAFMRTHVFVPLVRRLRTPIPIALFITGIISGFWHGFGWSFILWGLVQAAILLIVHHRRKLLPQDPKHPDRFVICAIILTFLTSCLLGVFFRSPRPDQALTIYAALLPNSHPSLLNWKAWSIFGVCGFVAWLWPDTHQFFRKYWTALDMRSSNKHSTDIPRTWITFDLSRRWAWIASVVFAVCLLLLDQSSRFIYVQF